MAENYKQTLRLAVAPFQYPAARERIVGDFRDRAGVRGVPPEEPVPPLDGSRLGASVFDYAIRGHSHRAGHGEMPVLPHAPRRTDNESRYSGFY